MNSTSKPKLEHTGYAILETVEDILDENTRKALRVHLIAENFDLEKNATKELIASMRNFLKQEYDRDLSFKDRVKRTMDHLKRLHLVSKQDLNNKLPSYQLIVEVVVQMLPDDPRFRYRINELLKKSIENGLDEELAVSTDFLKKIHGIIKDTAIQIDEEKNKSK